MASAPTSSLGFLDLHGRAVDGPTEWTRGYVHIKVPQARWQGVALTRNGELVEVYLRPLAGEPRVVADWPLSGTGHYRLELTDGGSREELKLSVWPRKISKAGYFQLLDDLEQLPASLAIALQKGGALAGIKLPPPGEATLASELQRLRRAIGGTEERPGLAKVLRSLAPDPYMVLRSTEVWLPRDRARRVHPARLGQAFAIGHNVDASGQPERLPETQVEHTPDVYENRLVRAFHDHVSLRIRRLQARLRSGTLTDATDELSQLSRSLSAARREATFLDHVTPPRQLPTQLTMVLLRRPAYRAALEGYLEYRRTVSIRLEEPGLESPLENLPSLYETWGTLQVIKAAADTATQLGFTVTERIFHRDQSGLFLHVLKNGRAAIILRHERSDTTVKVFPQRTYHPRGIPLRSASYEQKPDIALEVHQPGQPQRVLIFDPKYKLRSEELEGEITNGRPQKVDIDKMHAYRDAIRDHDDRRVVEYAAIMYPGAASERFGTGLEAIAARPDEASALQGKIRSVLLDMLKDGTASGSDAGVVNAV